MSTLYTDCSIAKGVVAGFIAGCAASAVMNGFTSMLTKANARPENQTLPSGGADENATIKAAKAVSEGVLDHRLSDDEKEIAGPAMHYAFGSLSGGIQLEASAKSIPLPPQVAEACSEPRSGWPQMKLPFRRSDSPKPRPNTRPRSTCPLSPPTSSTGPPPK